MSGKWSSRQARSELDDSTTRDGDQMPRSFLAVLVSALLTSVVPDILRVTLEDFFSRLWRLPAFSRRILPEPVTLKRFLAPECVLFFGISLALYLVYVVWSRQARPTNSVTRRFRDRGSRSAC